MWIFITALRLSATEQALQYPKFALVCFCAAMASRICIATWRERGWGLALVPAMLWGLVAALLLFLGFRAWLWWAFGGMAVLGTAIALIPVKRGVLPRLFWPAQILGVVGLAGAFFMGAVGALP
jgi:hypothetical protein